MAAGPAPSHLHTHPCDVASPPKLFHEEAGCACSDAYLAAQQRRQWDTSIENAQSIDNGEFNVGLLGLGLFIALSLKSQLLMPSIALRHRGSWQKFLAMFFLCYSYLPFGCPQQVRPWSDLILPFLSRFIKCQLMQPI